MVFVATKLSDRTIICMNSFIRFNRFGCVEWSKRRNFHLKRKENETTLTTIDTMAIVRLKSATFQFSYRDILQTHLPICRWFGADVSLDKVGYIPSHFIWTAAHSNALFATAIVVVECRCCCCFRCYCCCIPFILQIANTFLHLALCTVSYFRNSHMKGITFTVWKIQ